MHQRDIKKRIWCPARWYAQPKIIYRISTKSAFLKQKFSYLTPCRIRSDRQTTSLTLTTGVCEAGTKMRGASNMNIHYDVTGLLTAAWRSHSGQIVWAAWINCELAREEEGGGGFWTHSTYTGYPGSAGGRQLDRWRWYLTNVIRQNLTASTMVMT